MWAGSLALSIAAAVQSLLRSGAQDLRIESTGVRAHWKKSPECFLPERVRTFQQGLPSVEWSWGLERPGARR